MKLIRSITRWVPEYGLYVAPRGLETSVRLMQGDHGDYVLVTDWACLAAVHGEQTTDSQMIAALGRSFATEGESLAYAKSAAPYAGNPTNERIREELIAARRRDGNISGDAKIADRYDVSIDRIVGIATGKYPAPKCAEVKLHRAKDGSFRMATCNGWRLKMYREGGSAFEQQDGKDWFVPSEECPYYLDRILTAALAVPVA